MNVLTQIIQVKSKMPEYKIKIKYASSYYLLVLPAGGLQCTVV